MAQKHPEEKRKALGRRLAAARTLKGYSLAKVSMLLNEAGIEYGRAAIGAWEDGRNVPDALVLRRLAKIYGQSTDALLWDDAASMEAMQWAAQFDGLKPAQQERLRAIWMAFIAEAADDSTVESRMPITQERPGAVIIDEALLDGPPRRRSSRT